MTNYDASTVAMLRAVLNELLTSEAFARQDKYSAVDLAQSILQLAAKGERDAGKIKNCMAKLLLVEPTLA